MTHDPARSRPPLFSQIDVAQSAYHPPVAAARSGDSEIHGLLRQLVAGQDRQNELLEELIGQISSNQRQRYARTGPMETGQLGCGGTAGRRLRPWGRSTPSFSTVSPVRSATITTISWRAISCSASLSIVLVRGWPI